jgi:exodeoxyribonuclease VII large subunit
MTMARGRGRGETDSEVTVTVTTQLTFGLVALAPAPAPRNLPEPANDEDSEPMPEPLTPELLIAEPMTPAPAPTALRTPLPAPPLTAPVGIAARPLTTTAPVGSAPVLPIGPLGTAPAEKKPDEPRVFAVTELVRAARLTMESRFADVRVEGEISGLKRSGPGHIYFSLKDAEAQIESVMFSREASRLKFKVADGQQVRCRGRLTIYEGRGRFQMTITAMEPAGAGLLALAFEELKQKLAAEGLFAAGRKRPLPFLPRRIGIVTSPTGAVIRDIVRVAHRRFPVSLLLVPTPVQGEGAALSIMAALRAIARVPDVDLIILARGGGSLEDLWCFNDEALARAIAACRVPIISAVGHETDFTIADFVADLRAPTPSAAAEMAVPMLIDLEAELAVLRRRCARAMTAEIANRRLVVERARRRVGDPRRLVDARRQALDDLLGRAGGSLRANVARRTKLLAAVEARLLRAHPQRRIGEQRAQLTTLLRRLQTAMATRLTARHRALEGFAGKLGSLSPLSVLDRGYALARRSDGHLVTGAQSLAPGDALSVRFRDGEVETRVQAVRKEEPEDPKT